jgi:hypothetical protein
VAVDKQTDEPIPVAISVLFKRGEQSLDLGLGEVLTDPIGFIPLAAFRTGRITLFSALGKLHHFRRHCWPPVKQLVA